jgi:alkylated DNA repair dioxygenase AlkB
MAAAQLFETAPPSVLPDGFAYRPDFVTAGEAAELAGWLATLPFQAFQFHGYEGKRRVVSFGWQYDFTRSHLIKADDMPAELLPIRARAAAFADLAPDELQQCLLNEYLPGAPIGWHRDRPVFDKVVGVSLGADTVMRFRRREGTRWARENASLAGRSAYLLDGPARRDWEHSLPPAEAHRYSITFRNLRASRLSRSGGITQSG